MMMDVGMTLRAGQPMYKLTRSSISIDTPDGKKIPLATNGEYLNVDLRKLEQRARTNPDEIRLLSAGSQRQALSHQHVRADRQPDARVR
jgi:hypothetical protein